MSLLSAVISHCCYKPVKYASFKPSFNKKLRYHEEHSASVVLCWCTL